MIEKLYRLGPLFFIPESFLAKNLKELVKSAFNSPILLGELYFRLFEISATLSKHTLVYSSDQLLKNLPIAGRLILKRRLKLKGRRLANVFEDLGPTFIKIGQVLSTRPDLVSSRIATELRLLQDKVTPFKFSDVKKIIEEDLGEPIEKLFWKFEKTPVASASIAQVHRAVMRDGREVAIKVQRPAVHERARKDLIILRMFFASLEKIIPRFKNLSTTESIDEVGVALEKQLDFTIEAKNNKEFTSNFINEPDIGFPKLIEGMCTRRVLGMELIEGARGDEPELVGSDPKVIARLGLKALIKMSFIDGFLHCDPHPGNVFILPGNKIVFIDLGLTSKLPDDVQKVLLDLIVALVNGSAEETAKVFIKTCYHTDTLDWNLYVSDLDAIIEKHLKTTISQMEMSLIFKELFELVWKHNLKLNADYAMVFMALITVEGIGKRLDPELDIMSALQEIVAGMVFSGMARKLQHGATA